MWFCDPVGSPSSALHVRGDDFGPESARCGENRSSSLGVLALHKSGEAAGCRRGPEMSTRSIIREVIREEWKLPHGIVYMSHRQFRGDDGAGKE